MIKSKDLLIKKIIVASIIILIILLTTISKENTKDILNKEVSEQKIQNTVAVYIQDESSADGYSKADTIPTSGYAFNEEMSYCGIDGNRNDSITLNYEIETQMLTVSPMTTSGTKCYLYFDEYTSSIKDTLLSYYPTVLTRTDFSTTVTNTTTGVIYKSANSSQYDNDGEVYYFAGNPIDNWIYFGGFYWRIIRFNGNGTVRLIYAGNSTTGSGEDDQIRISSFNNSSNMSYYVGLSYDGTQHGIGTESTILIELNNWYNSSESGNLGTNYGNYIDNNTGFCSDRNMSSGSGWSIQPSREIRYAAYERLVTNKNPSLGCSSNDILNIPIGLITADEMAYAGGTTTSENQNYYLSTGQEYWTMTPSLAYNSGTAVNFWAGSSGWVFNFGTTVAYSRGIRPVINLRSDVTISSGNGTASHPFVINTD